MNLRIYGVLLVLEKLKLVNAYIGYSSSETLCCLTTPLIVKILIIKLLTTLFKRMANQGACEKDILIRNIFDNLNDMTYLRA